MMWTDDVELLFLEWMEWNPQDEENMDRWWGTKMNDAVSVGNIKASNCTEEMRQHISNGLPWTLAEIQTLTSGLQPV